MNLPEQPAGETDSGFSGMVVTFTLLASVFAFAGWIHLDQVGEWLLIGGWVITALIVLDAIRLLEPLVLAAGAVFILWCFVALIKCLWLIS